MAPDEWAVWYERRMAPIVALIQRAEWDDSDYGWDYADAGDLYDFAFEEVDY